MASQKTQQELYKALFLNRSYGDVVHGYWPFAGKKPTEEYEEQGMSASEISEQFKKDYQEAVENFDFSKKIQIDVVRYDGEVKKILIDPLDEIWGEDAIKDVLAFSKTLTINDIARVVASIEQRGSLVFVRDEVMNSPAVKNQAEANPEAWGELVKRHLYLGDPEDGDVVAGRYIKKAEEFMLHSPLVSSEKLRQQVKKILASVKKVDLTTGIEPSVLYDNKSYDFDINPEDLRRWTTEVCPNTEWLALPFARDGRFYRRTNISDEHIQEIAKIKNLKTLIVPAAKLTDKSFETLGQMKTLEKLDLNVEASEEQLAALSKLSHLKSLHLASWPDKKVMSKLFPQLVPYKKEWIGPGHEKYEEQKALYDAEQKRLAELTGEKWKDKFYEALHQGDKELAREILELNGLLRIENEQGETTSYWGTEKELAMKKGGVAPEAWFKNTGSVERMDFLDLGNNNVAVGFIYDGSSWNRKPAFRAWGGGIAYSRSTQVGIINLDKGVVAESDVSGTVQWRDPHSSSRDINITNLEHFLKKEGNSVKASLESYGRELVATTVDIPESKVISRLREASKWVPSKGKAKVSLLHGGKSKE